MPVALRLRDWLAVVGGGRPTAGGVPFVLLL